MARLDVNNLSVMLVVRDLRNFLCDIAVALGRSREDWTGAGLADECRMLREENTRLRALVATKEAA